MLEHLLLIAVLLGLPLDILQALDVANALQRFLDSVHCQLDLRDVFRVDSKELEPVGKIGDLGQMDVLGQLKHPEGLHHVRVHRPQQVALLPLLQHHLLELVGLAELGQLLDLLLVLLVDDELVVFVRSAPLLLYYPFTNFLLDVIDRTIGKLLHSLLLVSIFVELLEKVWVLNELGDMEVALLLLGVVEHQEEVLGHDVLDEIEVHDLFVVLELVFVEHVGAVVHVVLVAVDRVLVLAVKDDAFLVELDAATEAVKSSLAEVEVLDREVVVDLEYVRVSLLFVFQTPFFLF